MDSKKAGVDYSLCLVTDRDLMSAARLEDAVEQAILGGVTMVQLREKNISGEEFFRRAQTLKTVTDRHNVPLIINDRVDIALAIGAAGVHVGQSDIPASAVRRIVGDGMILGVSASNVDEARRAAEDGAGYIGVGAMFSTGTKTDARIVSKSELAAIRSAVTTPIMIIGGISAQTLPNFGGMNIDGIAVVSAILSRPDIQAAAAEMKHVFLAGRI